jgi:NDP-sugar pyrophosphorylase family protein
MIAIMLCAGFGTRLHPLTKTVPKGLLDVAGKPILDYQMPQLLDLPELRSIHLVSNSRFVSQFYAWHLKWRPHLDSRGISMHLYSDGSQDEDARLGSVGDLAFLLRCLEVDEPVVVTAGDNIYRFPLRPIAESFLASGQNLVLALREPSYQVRQRYAVIEFGENDRVARLHDQPEDPPTEWVCPSLHFLQPRAVRRAAEFLAAGGDHDSFTAFIDHVMIHEPVYAVRKPDTRVWLDVETRYMYKKANEVLGEEALMVEEE